MGEICNITKISIMGAIILVFTFKNCNVSNEYYAHTKSKDHRKCSLFSFLRQVADIYTTCGDLRNLVNRAVGKFGSMPSILDLGT